MVHRLLYKKRLLISSTDFHNFKIKDNLNNGKNSTKYYSKKKSMTSGKTLELALSL